YAESVSNGNMQTARTILDGLVLNKKDNLTQANRSDIVVKQIKEGLQKQGYFVTEQVGQSNFKCSLAVKVKEEDEEYTASILLDDDLHYSNDNLVEQYYQRPAILQSFGWKSINIFAKDWLEQPEKVLAYIVKRIREAPVTEPNLIEDTIEPLHEPEADVDIAGDAVLIIDTPAPKAETVLPGFEDVLFDRYTFTEAGSNKFWEAATQNEKLIVRYGKINTRGQVQVKTFPNAEKAELERQKLVAEKTKKGYVKI
ncbi:MAG: WGR domain-containing protein, partial [Chitinophagaceae bacterium]